jgi:hypothetical protein
MPIFFFVGGFANYATIDALRRKGQGSVRWWSCTQCRGFLRAHNTGASPQTPLGTCKPAYLNPLRRRSGTQVCCWRATRCRARRRTE